MLTVLTWFWNQPGGRVTYTPLHVNIWADSVRRHLAMPHRIACVTDLTEGLDPSIEIIPPPHEFENWRIPSWGEARPQCLRRISMFRADAAKIFGERFVCMDLDCVIGDQLDPLFDTDVDFKIYAGTGPGRYYNGSMMMIRAGSRPQVYNNFSIEGATAAGAKHIGSDQAWIAHCLGPNEATWDYEDRVNWWGATNRTEREQSRILFFPGGVKPWDIAEQGKEKWVSDNYRRSGQGRALLLGYASNVWEEAEKAIDEYDFAAVIASPEVAAQWPVDVFAIASDDRQAERLAKLHGFEDNIFCGRSAEIKL